MRTEDLLLAILPAFFAGYFLITGWLALRRGRMTVVNPESAAGYPDPLPLVFSLSKLLTGRTHPSLQADPDRVLQGKQVRARAYFHLAFGFLALLVALGCAFATPLIELAG